MRILWRAGVPLVVALLIAGCGGSTTTKTVTVTAEPKAPAVEDTDADGIPDDTDPDPYSAENTASDGSEDELAEGLEEGSDEPAQTTVGLNEGAKDDGLGFKVRSIDEVDSVAPYNEFADPIYPPPGGKLYVADVQIKNYGDVPADPFCGGGSAVLLDSKERNYHAEDALDSNEWVCGDGLAPGFNIDTKLAFKVPKNFKLGGLVLWNSDSSDSGGSESNIAVIP